MSKGSRRERQAVEIYRKGGFMAYRPATVQYGENDLYNVFDLLCVSPYTGAVDAVQVKSNGARGITKWTKDTKPFRKAGWLTLYAVPYDNEGWRIIDVRDGRRDVIDERDTTGKMGETFTGWLRQRNGIE